MEDFGTNAIFTTTQDQCETLPLQNHDDGVALNFTTDAGLYQFSVIADARRFDWDDLYIELDAYHNSGQHTGPWDFNPVENNYPLLPSYWVYLDGKKIGLWFFQRVSLEDLAAKRFRGRMAFWVREAGKHRLQIIPYRPITLRWTSVRLETDPEDVLLPSVKRTFNTTPQIHQWRNNSFWEAGKHQLETTHNIYQKPLTDAFDAIALTGNVLTGTSPLSAKAPNEWIVLLAAHRLEKREGVLQELLRAVDDKLDLSHWGNPREDGYGHDGDMTTAFTMRAMAWTYFGLFEELGEERRAKMRDKMRLQGERFINLALLNRDYWGGSLSQDHGWRSLHTFCFAALALSEEIADAREWLRFLLPRVKRSLAAMPRDGVVPKSSHHSLVRYLNDVSGLRDIWLAWNGEDIYDQSPFHEIVDFVSVVCRGDSSLELQGASGFFNQIAAKYQDEQAAWISQQLLQLAPAQWSHVVQRQGYYQGIVEGFLTRNPPIPVEEPPIKEALQFFPDSGHVYYHDPQNDISFQLTCAPYSGYYNYRQASGSCDRMGDAPGAGHFELKRGNITLLATPDGGYALRSIIRSCLLINDEGQIGDIGYPMSVPSKTYNGEEINSVHWDENTQTGAVRLNLTPAYPDSAGLASYSREFLISSESIIVRDHVVLNSPQKLSWLFQGKRENGIELNSPQKDDAKSTYSARFGSGDNWITLTAQSPNISLLASIHETPVVWAHSSPGGFSPFDHVRFDTTTASESVIVDFAFRW